MPTDIRQHLVSHRLRGFSDHENSLSALEAALRRGVRHIEIDTRVTGDGEILVFHDARLDPVTESPGPVSDYRLDTDGRPRFRGHLRERVPTLEEFLARFAAESSDAELLLDIKDPGAERRHCEAIERTGLEARVRVMSWWPEVLLAVHAIQPRLRLVLSFVPLGRAPWWLQFVRLLGSGGLVRLLGHVRGQSRQARYMQDTVFRREPLLATEPVGAEAIGRYPVCFTEGLPEAEVSTALIRSGGAIATWPRVIDPGLLAEAHERGLDVISFSLDDRAGVERMLREPAPALVFTNNAGLFDQAARAELR